MNLPSEEREEMGTHREAEFLKLRVSASYAWGACECGPA